jgi:hypothetical protein
MSECSRQYVVATFSYGGTPPYEQDAAIIAVTHDEKIFDRFDLIFHLRDGRLDQAAPGQPG